MRRLCSLATAVLLSGCGNRGSVTFNLKVPDNTLFNPIAQPDLVSEYDIRTANGTVIGIASAVQSSAGGDNGRLPLGALMPADTPEDVFVTALSGGNLLGMARIRDVTIKSGQHATYDAELRKPLIFVGSSLPAETNSGNKTVAVQILDPNASTDLARAPFSPPQVAGGMTAGATTWDGRFVVVAQGQQLTAFDNGLGHNITGSYALPFAPARVMVAPRDTAVVALDPGSGPSSDGRLAIVTDVNGFTGSPGSANPKIVTLAGAVARTAAFSPDGTRIYILTGGAAADPCSPGAMPPANAIQVFELDGSMSGSYPLAGFASDLTVDPQTGTLVIADAAGNKISTLDPMSGAVTAVEANLTCPSAVRVVNGVAFAVTTDRDATLPNAWLLRRIPLRTDGQSTATSFDGPEYHIPIDSTPSPNGNIMTASLPVRPASIEAYELAVTPDGGRAQFATRAHYKEVNTKFTFSQQDCTANFDIVEYGLYAVDLRTGNASYQMRAQLVQSPANGNHCVDCTYVILGVTYHQYADCDSTAGDRPAGLAASFGQ
jgi:hypothetical protein